MSERKKTKLEEMAEEYAKRFETYPGKPVEEIAEYYEAGANAALDEVMKVIEERLKHYEGGPTDNDSIRQRCYKSSALETLKSKLEALR